MRIRSKLVTLIAVPLIALTIVAAFGFSNQSALIETAEDAETTVIETQAVQNAVLAISNERILMVGDRTSALGDAAVATDTAIEAIIGSTRIDPSVVAAGETAGQLVASARSDAENGVSLYGLAVEGLLRLQIDSAEHYPNASARNAAVVNHTAVQSLQLREWAWIAYFQLEQTNRAGDLDPDAVATVIADFAVAENTLRTAVTLAEAGRSERYNSVLQTSGAVELQQLEATALDDLNEGELTVERSEAISGLIDYRARWSEAIIEQGQALEADVADSLKSANDLRSLFSLLAMLGLVVLAGLVFVVYRSITSPLASLLTRASAVADEELPDLMNALREGGRSEDLPTATPIPVTSNDEIGQLVEAFNNVQTTAYDLATEQALSRRNVADMFVNLGRRNQQLLQRILGQLTELEQHEEDPDQLADLFELDNIVTRMRRNAESLLALAGAQTARQWSQPIEMEHTIRAAFGEVEGYERIDVTHLDGTMVAGRAVADITHLLAELLENALNFSDSRTTVEVNGMMAKGGYLITISDQGIGMSQGDLAENNSRITDPPPLDQVPTRFLGLYVVGRLAERHGVEVRLVEGQIQGTVARVLLPDSVLVTEATESAGLNDDDLDLDDDETAVAEEGLAVAESDRSDHIESENAPAFARQVAKLPSRKQGTADVDQQSPLEETHDLDGELVALTEDPADGSEDVGGSALPVRERGESDDSGGDAGGLPVRKRGSTLEQDPAPEVPEPAVQKRKAAETSTEAASGFSSMLSAFSSGISLGLEAAEDEEEDDEAKKGEDS